MRRILLFLVLGCLVASCARPRATGQSSPSRFSKLRTDGTRVVDAEGQPVRLRGVNLGNWLLLEMWMLGLEDPAIRDQHTLVSTLNDRFGAQAAAEMIELYREEWIGKLDFRRIRDSGMNVVRLPIHYSLVEDDAHPFAVRPDGWKWIDRAVDWAEANGLYIILDLHGVAGGQSNDQTTGRIGQNAFWDNEECRKRTAWLWREMAARYRNRACVAAYDLLNEPWGASPQRMSQEALALYHAVREVDPETIVILPGTASSLSCYSNASEAGLTNAMFTMHFYPGIFDGAPPTLETHARFLTRRMADWRATMDRLGAPLLVGEFQPVYTHAERGATVRRWFDACNDAGWPATLWSYKVLTKKGGIELGTWGMITNREPMNAPNLQTASREEIESWFRRMGAADLADEDLLHWMTSRETPPPLPDPGEAPLPLRIPPANDSLPDDWQAIDIGGSLAGGQQTSTDDNLILYASGANVWDTRDQFRFVFRKAAGDFVLETTIRGIEFPHLFAKAGLMARASLAPGAAQTSVALIPPGWIESLDRTADDAATLSKLSGPLATQDVMLRLERRGSQLRRSWKSTSSGWTHADSVLASDAPLFVGLFACSHDSGRLFRVESSLPKLSGETLPVSADDLVSARPRAPHNEAPPPPWKQLDIGGALPGGLRIDAPDAWTLYAAGDDIWNAADQFQFVARQIDGNFVLQARVANLQRTHEYAKAGLMIRAGEAPGAPCALLNVFPDGRIDFVMRGAPGASMQSMEASAPRIESPWLRLERRGAAIAASVSGDGQNWIDLGSVAIPALDAPVLTGLAALSHDNQTFAEVTFANIQLNNLPSE